MPVNTSRTEDEYIRQTRKVKLTYFGTDVKNDNRAPPTDQRPRTRSRSQDIGAGQLGAVKILNLYLYKNSSLLITVLTFSSKMIILFYLSRFFLSKSPLRGSNSHCKHSSLTHTHTHPGSPPLQQLSRLPYPDLLKATNGYWRELECRGLHTERCQLS